MSLRDPTLRDLVGAVGALALVVGLVAAFAPERLPEALTGVADEVAAAVEAWVAVLVLSLVVFAYAVYRFWRADDGRVERLVDEEDRNRAVPDLEDEAVDFDPDRPGRAFDYAMARTVTQLEADPNADAWEADRIRADLETAVVAVLTGDGRDPSAARAAVTDGSWTDDRQAAAFLGGPDAPGLSLRQRVYAWLFPARAFRGRVERVVDEIGRLAASDDRDAGGAGADGREDAGADGDGDGPDGGERDTERDASEDGEPADGSPGDVAAGGEGVAS